MSNASRASPGCPARAIIRGAADGHPFAAEAAERYSALLGPELHHLLIVERQWTDGQYQTWVFELLDHDLLG